MAIIPDFYKNAVVSIGVRQNNSTVQWIGTGFFMVSEVDEQGRGYPFLVTNKHVCQNKDHIVIRMREQNTENLKEVNAILLNEDGSPKYKTHTNQKIDIAVLPLDGSFITNNHLDFPAFNIETHAMSSTELRDNTRVRDKLGLKKD